MRQIWGADFIISRDPGDQDLRVPVQDAFDLVLFLDGLAPAADDRSGRRALFVIPEA